MTGDSGLSCCPPKGGRGVPMSLPLPPPPCLESQGCQFDPTSLYLLFCSSAQSCCSFCLIISCFWPVPLTSFSLNLHLLSVAKALGLVCGPPRSGTVAMVLSSQSRKDVIRFCIVFASCRWPVDTGGLSVRRQDALLCVP